MSCWEPRVGYDSVRHVSDTPRAPGEAPPEVVIAGLRAANGRLRELLAERDVQLAEKDTRIAALEAQLDDLAAQVPDLVRSADWIAS